MDIKNDIYISCHRHTGIRYARILQFELDKRGYRVFLDDNSGFLGNKLNQIIRETRIFMMVLSEDYLEHCSTKTNWTRQEIMLALNSKKDIIIVNPDNSFVGIPPKIPNEISTFIRNSQWVSISFGTKLSHSIDTLVNQYISPIVVNSQNEANMKQGKEYYAFISYKREDEKWAKWLQDKLEHYHLPTNVRKNNPSLPQSIRPVFKDTSELAAGVLADEIYEALDNSKYLIVICSPRAAQSKWVEKEVQTFIDMGRSDRIIPFIVGGKQFSENPEEECFPSSLLNLPNLNISY